MLTDWPGSAGKSIFFCKNWLEIKTNIKKLKNHDFPMFGQILPYWNKSHTFCVNLKMFGLFFSLFVGFIKQKVPNEHSFSQNPGTSPQMKKRNMIMEKFHVQLSKKIHSQ